jgi:hypothetical protein
LAATGDTQIKARFLCIRDTFSVAPFSAAVQAQLLPNRGMVSLGSSQDHKSMPLWNQRSKVVGFSSQLAAPHSGKSLQAGTTPSSFLCCRRKRICPQGRFGIEPAENGL